MNQSYGSKKIPLKSNYDYDAAFSYSTRKLTIEDHVIPEQYQTDPDTMRSSRRQPGEEGKNNKLWLLSNQDPTFKINNI